MKVREGFVSSGKFCHDYRIVRTLGSGGDGSVFLVRHIATDQLRAAKRLQVKSSERFHELNLMKKLNHPSLPEVIDVLEESDCIWLILSYVRGKSLQESAQCGFSMEEILSVLCQLTEILCYLHHRDPPILHLDIKPTNLMVRSDGSLVLIDFGAAVRWREGMTLPECRGTPGFAAPEQYHSPVCPDVRTDIYGIGAVLRYLLKHASSSGNDYFSRKTEGIMTRCLSENRSARYSCCEELLRDLNRLSSRMRRRRKYKEVSAVLFLLAGITIFVTAGWKNDMKKKKNDRSERYVQLLQEAEKLGWKQSCSRYLDARSLCPERSEVYFHVLNRVREDHVFSDEEEEFLQELLFTADTAQEENGETCLRKDPAKYGEFSYLLGMTYWYYAGTDGKTAAEKWFRSAVEYTEKENKNGFDEYTGADKRIEVSENIDSENWLESARIHCRIAGYYGAIGKIEPGKGEEDTYRNLWRDLILLWNTKRFRKEDPIVRLQAAEEMLACMIMETAKLKGDGATKAQMRTVLDQIREVLYSTNLTHEEKKKREDSIQSAADACRRTFLVERGTNERKQE